MDKIVASVIYSPDNIKLDKRLKAESKKALDNFKKENREDEYCATTLISYKIEQSSRFI